MRKWGLRIGPHQVFTDSLNLFQLGGRPARGWGRLYPPYTEVIASPIFESHKRAWVWGGSGGNAYRKRII